MILGWVVRCWLVGNRWLYGFIRPLGYLFKSSVGHRKNNLAVFHDLNFNVFDLSLVKLISLVYRMEITNYCSKKLVIRRKNTM
jgi:hypothetical protein